MRRRGGDASFLIGIVLGIALGAAIAVILAESTQDRGLNLSEGVSNAKESLESKADEYRSRVQGAAEGATPTES